MNTRILALALASSLGLPLMPPSHAQEHAHAHHQGAAASVDDNACPPEHAAMGHCTPAAPETAHAHAGHDSHGSHGLREPRTPIPMLTDVDRAAAFPVLDHDHGHGTAIHSFVQFNRLEAWDAEHGTGQAWEASAWIGGDIHRLWLRSEGEREGGSTESANLDILYGRSLNAWWDVVVGVKRTFLEDSRTWAAFGVQGLAPYMFEVSATAYAGSGGQVQGTLEAEYDMLLTNRLILQPLVEATASLKDDPGDGIGSGLNSIEAGLRLRYEFSRRFAPYVGLVHERSFGDTALYREAVGGHARDTRVVAGVRIWF